MASGAKDQNYPSFPTVGEQTDEKLFWWVGLAATSWELLDGNLGLIVAGFAPRGQLPFEAMRDHGEQISFAQKANDFRKRAQGFFASYPASPAKHALAARTTKLIEQCEKLSMRRNHILHGVVQQFAGGGFVVVPSWNATKHRKLEDASAETVTLEYAYNGSMIDDFIKECAALREEAVDIAVKIRSI